jgi:hypothetical protein
MEKVFEPKWLTIQQSAETWGLHPNTIRNLITRGQLKAYRLGSRVIRIDANELNALFTDYKAGEFGIWNR